MQKEDGESGGNGREERADIVACDLLGKVSNGVRVVIDVNLPPRLVELS